MSVLKLNSLQASCDVILGHLFPLRDGKINRAQMSSLSSCKHRCNLLGCSLAQKPKILSLSISHPHHRMFWSNEVLVLSEVVNKSLSGVYHSNKIFPHNQPFPSIHSEIPSYFLVVGASHYERPLLQPEVL